MATITLEQLIEEGTEIRKHISYLESPSGVIRFYDEYRLDDNSKYETWRNMSLRYLSVNFPNDRCINDFEEAAKEFTKAHNSPKIFDKMLGVLRSCLVFPQVTSNLDGSNKIDKSIHVNVNQTQSQNQSLVLDVFLDAIKDELKGKQIKELKVIVKEEADPEKAKSKILNTVKSWGESIPASIIANIITNPAVWSGLM